MQWTINGQVREAEVDFRTSLLDLLREQFQLSGAKKGCSQGACGACTVLVGGERINACRARSPRISPQRISNGAVTNCASG